MASLIKPDRTIWLHALLLISAIALAYCRILNAGFMNWDDLDYVFNTKDISSGISPEQVKHWFTRNYLGNYQPLPVCSYALDHLVGGTNPLIYHLHSLLWHIAATLLVYGFISSLQDHKWIAFFVALLFAIHPVQTESVSWIAARNKSMNAVFYFSAMCFYVSYVKDQHKIKLVWVTLCGLLAYLCKATALALPLALFAVDVWLQRPLNNRKLWLEKLPLVLAGIPVALVTLAAQKEVTFLQHHSGFGWSNIVFAGYALVQYVVHLIFPAQLSALYPYPKAVTAGHVLYLFPAVALLAFMILAYFKGWRLWAGGILFFIVNLLPVLQLVQFGETLMADRYLYIASVGLWFPMVYYVFAMLENKSRWIAAGIYSLVCLVFLVLTFFRNAIWLNEINFWKAMLDKFPESTVAHYSIGAVYLNKGDLANAEWHMNKAVQYDPDNYKAWRNKSVLFMRRGKMRQALEALDISLKLYPYSKAYFTRALLYHTLNKCELAIADAKKVLGQQPDNARACYVKADCEEQLGNLNDAMNDYSQAIACDPHEPLFLIRRGLLQAKKGNKQAAFNDLNLALALKPGNGATLYYRALTHYHFGENPCHDLQRALQNGYTQAGVMLRKLCR